MTNLILTLKAIVSKLDRHRYRDAIMHLNAAIAAIEGPPIVKGEKVMEVEQ